MNRRGALDLICRLFALAVATVVAIPGVRFLLSPLSKSQESEGPVFHRLCRLDDLTPGEPRLFPIRGVRQDAWTTFPQETIGQVWVVRRTGADTAPEKASITAYSAVCPHLGCTIQRDPSGNNFVCPCHKAYFDNLGDPFSAEQMGKQLGKGRPVTNPSPRGMDLLDTKIVPADSDQHWVEVAYAVFKPNTAEKIPVA